MTDIAVDFAECSAMAGRVARMVYGDDTPEGAGGAPREGGDKRSPGKQSASQEEREVLHRARVQWFEQHLDDFPSEPPLSSAC